MFRFIIGAIVSIFMISLVRMILSAITREVGGSSKQEASRSTGRGSQQQQQQHSPPPGPPPNIQGGELRKCPTCSTYHTVSTIAGRTTGGEIVHFCSTGCRDKYQAA